MSGGNTVERHIDAVDAFARTLYVQAKQSSDLFDIAEAVKQLHIALRHLRLEVADPDSLFNDDSNPDAAEYKTQLSHVVEDCEFSLTQVQGLLDDGGHGVGHKAESLTRKLQNEKANIDGFLDAVQCQIAKPSATVLDGSQAGLDQIKDQVDRIASRMFDRRDRDFWENEDETWREFKSELEKEGFSREVLKKNKDVLRAYIRELESSSSRTGGAPPTVRGLLQYEAEATRSVVSSQRNDMVNSSLNNGNMGPLPARERKVSDDRPYETPDSRQPSSLDGMMSESNDSLALISTKDLVAMDGLNVSMAAMQLQPQGYPQYGASPNMYPQYYSSPHIAATLAAPGQSQDLAGSPSSFVLGSSPQFPPPLPTSSSVGSPPRQPGFGQPGPMPRAAPRLAPDRYGNQIPMEAQWTKINRNLISSEILARAGVRYEARPTYVAILGRLSREEINDLARQSADVRAARAMRQQAPARRHHGYRDRADSKSSRDDEEDDTDLWDSSDSTDVDDDKTSEKGTRSYPYIVSPPDKERGSPASTVQPKSILKNKNQNHVHFGPDPYEVEGKSPRSSREDHRRPRRYRDDRDGNDSRYRDSKDRRDRRYDDRDSGSRRRDHRDKDDRRSRGDRRESERDDRQAKKRAWGETLGAVGIGGAAVSLLTVLAEAAS